MKDNSKKLKNFLTNGFQTKSVQEKKSEPKPEPKPEPVVEQEPAVEQGPVVEQEPVQEEPIAEETVEEAPAEEEKTEEEAQPEPKPEPEEVPAVATDATPVAVSVDTSALEDKILQLTAKVQELENVIADLRENPPMPDMSAFVTTREQIKSLTTAIDRQNIEITNKKLTSSMEQIAAMREDFFKLCSGMKDKIDVMSAKDVLSSFEAYEVDMENILIDGGVFIGHFPYESLNTIHQRIVDVVPTDDPKLNGRIAARLSDGYKLGNKVLFKEKVTVYKYIDSAKEKAEAGSETVSQEEPASEKETASEVKEAPAEEPTAKTVSETSSETKNTENNTEEEE